MAQLPSLCDLQSTNSALELEIAHLRVFVKLTEADYLTEAEYPSEALYKVVLHEIEQTVKKWRKESPKQPINNLTRGVNSKIEELKEQMNTIVKFVMNDITLATLEAEKLNEEGTKFNEGLRRAILEADNMRVQGLPQKD